MVDGTILFSSISLLSMCVLCSGFLYIVLYEHSGHVILKLNSFSFSTGKSQKWLSQVENWLARGDRRLKVLVEWTQFWNMSLGLIFWIVMQNFAAIWSAVLEKMTFEVAFFGKFPDIPVLKLSLPCWVMERWRYKSVRLAEYRSCIFCKQKPIGETQFWKELEAPYTVTSTCNNEINFDETLPFIIFLTPISCDGSNCLWRQRLLPSPCSLWRHKQMLVGVIQSLASGKCQTFCLVTGQYRFHQYLCFHCVFCVVFFFLYIVLYEQSDHIVLKLYSF